MQRRRVSLIFLFIVGMLQIHWATATASSDAFPSRKTYENQEYRLFALATLDVTIFAFEVYKVGIYSALPRENLEKTENFTQPIFVQIKFSREIEKEKLAKSWVSDLKKACQKNCIPILDEAKIIANALQDVKENDLFIYHLAKDKVTIKHNDRLVGELKSEFSSKAVLNAFVGDGAPSDLREDLLKDALERRGTNPKK